MPHIGFGELLVVLIIALIIFGPGKLPSVGASIGKAISEFKKASKELVQEPKTVNDDKTNKSSKDE
jgi:sec-independent protein translocase protein TatA